MDDSGLSQRGSGTPSGSIIATEIWGLVCSKMAPESKNKPPHLHFDATQHAFSTPRVFPSTDSAILIPRPRFFKISFPSLRRLSSSPWPLKPCRAFTNSCSRIWEKTHDTLLHTLVVHKVVTGQAGLTNLPSRVVVISFGYALAITGSTVLDISANLARIRSYSLNEGSSTCALRA